MKNAAAMLTVQYLHFNATTDVPNFCYHLINECQIHHQNTGKHQINENNGFTLFEGKK